MVPEKLPGAGKVAGSYENVVGSVAADRDVIPNATELGSVLGDITSGDTLDKFRFAALARRAVSRATLVRPPTTSTACASQT
jgi:hypothetical protein